MVKLNLLPRDVSRSARVGKETVRMPGWAWTASSPEAARLGLWFTPFREGQVIWNVSVRQAGRGRLVVQTWTRGEVARFE